MSDWLGRQALTESTSPPATTCRTLEHTNHAAHRRRTGRARDSHHHDPHACLFSGTIGLPAVEDTAIDDHSARGSNGPTVYRPFVERESLERTPTNDDSVPVSGAGTRNGHGGRHPPEPPMWNKPSHTRPLTPSSPSPAEADLARRLKVGAEHPSAILRDLNSRGK